MGDELNSFMRYFKSASENVRSLSKLYLVSDGITGSEYWESEDVWDEAPYGPSEEETNQAEKLLELFCKLDEDDQRASGLKRHQCWACQGYFTPYTGGGGVRISFLNHTDEYSGSLVLGTSKGSGDVFRVETATICSGCHFHLVDESGGITFKHIGLC
jgi:hypothetical protein